MGSSSSAKQDVSSSHTISCGWRAVLGCTHEALSLYRICLGMLLLLELLLRYRFLHPFYTDEGTLPLRLLLPIVDDLYKVVCIHCQFGYLWQQQILLTIQVLAATLFTVGYQTKLMTILSWYLYFSSTLRNTWLSFILDRYFHYLLFYAIFLPLDCCWTLPSLLLPPQQRSHQQKSTIIVSPATIALKLLVFWIYLDAGGGKYLDPLQGWSFNAKPLPALDTYARHTLVARYLYALLGPVGLRCLTPTVVYVELLVTPMAMIAAYFGNATIVYISVALICSLHVGISMCINNAVLLSLVACSVWCIFLPIGWENNSNNNFDHRHHHRHSNTATPELSSPTTIPQAQRQEQRKVGGRSFIMSSSDAVSAILILSMVAGNLWFATLSSECEQSVKHIWSSLLHNRWNVFVGAEEYVTWEIAPGLLADGSVVDIWGRKETVDWSLPGTGAPCTSTARVGRWRSFPYLAGLEGDDADALWSYLCRQWDTENGVDITSGYHERKLLKFNFFMLQADVLPNMGFSPTRKRLIYSYECASTTNHSENNTVVTNAGSMKTSTKKNNNATETEISKSSEEEL